MAARAMQFLLAALPVFTAALQVAPNSPCASFCIDDSSLDVSDPNSSNTNGSDIVCNDGDFSSQATGQKFERCLSCLQDSPFVQAPENDQQWFFYNLRYAVDYCVFGFPNASDVGSNPCMTSTACGGLQTALEDGNLDPLNMTEYSYCDADGNAMTGEFYQKCLACVQASDDQHFLTNFLVALEAGCQQQPPPGKVVGLNDTVFTTSLVTIVTPSASAAPGSHGIQLPTTTIAVIAIAGVVVILFSSGCIYVQHRKRKARREIRSGRRGHRPVSSLSFRCQTHLTPKSPYFPNPDAAEDSSIEEKMFGDSSETLGSNPSKRESSLWKSSNPVSSFDARSGPVKTKPMQKETLPLKTITTSLPTIPSSVRHANSPKFSPDDYYTTPTSSTSAVSTTQLLPIKPYVPAEHGMSSPSLGTAQQQATFSPGGGLFSSPTSANTASPRLSQNWPLPAPWEQPLVDAPGRELTRPCPPPPPKQGHWRTSTGKNQGSPVESRQITVDFPAPPKRPGR